MSHYSKSDILISFVLIIVMKKLPSIAQPVGPRTIGRLHRMFLYSSCQFWDPSICFIHHLLFLLVLLIVALKLQEMLNCQIIVENVPLYIEVYKYVIKYQLTDLLVPDYVNHMTIIQEAAGSRTAYQNTSLVEKLIYSSCHFRLVNLSQVCLSRLSLLVDCWHFIGWIYPHVRINCCLSNYSSTSRGNSDSPPDS